MTPDQSDIILNGLTSAFPNVRLEEDTPDVWRKHLAPLDFDVADRAVGQCVNNLKFFPSIAEFREFYRLERHNSPPKRAPEPEGEDGIPTWVHVWWWMRQIEDKPRRFPQMESSMSDWVLTQEWREMSGSTAPGHIDTSYRKGKPEEVDTTVEEYALLEREWVEAGSPRFGLDDFVPLTGQGVELTDCLPGDCTDCRKPYDPLRSFGESGRALCPSCLGARLRVGAKAGATP